MYELLATRTMKYKAVKKKTFNLNHKKAVAKCLNLSTNSRESYRVQMTIPKDG